MYIATYIIDIAALIYLMGLLYSSSSLNSNRKKPFILGILITIIIILAEIGTVFTDGGSLDLRNINIFFNIIGFSLTPIIPLVIISIFNRSIINTHKYLIIPTLINIIVTILSPQFRLIFYVDASNQYMRGSYFFIFIIVYVINFLFLFLATVDAGRKYNYPIMQKLVALSVFTIIGTSIQIVYPLAFSSWHSVTLSLFLYFLLMSEFDSSFDTLTGLYNRATFDRVAKQIVKPRALSVIVLDINDFKIVNDTYGHVYGDEVIKNVAVIMRESFKKGYTCYRFGGDEFSIISTETNQEKIETQLRTMTNALAEMREQGYLVPTVSYGYSIYNGEGKMDFYNILKEADDQMYCYKKKHKVDDYYEISLFP